MSTKKPHNKKPMCYADYLKKAKKEDREFCAKKLDIVTVKKILAYPTDKCKRR